MNHEREPSREILAPLRRIELAPAVVEPTSIERRQRVVSRLERIVVDTRIAHQRQRRFAIVGIAAAAAAAAIVFWFGYHSFERRSVVVTKGSAPAPARLTTVSGRISVRPNAGASRAGQMGQPLEAHDEITVEPSGSAALVLGSGAQVRLDGGSRVELAPNGNAVLALGLGSIGLSVPKLEPGQRLSVATRQALVTVVGTRFWVTVVPATASSDERTCVGVSEGQVRIAAHDAVLSLAAGGQWSSNGLPCVAPKDSPNAPPNEPGVHPSSSPVLPMGHSPQALRPVRSAVLLGTGAESQPSAPTSVATGSQPPPTAAFEESSLEEQNQLFAAAVAARQAAQPERAAEILMALLRRFPESPLVPAAVRELDKARHESVTQKPGAP